jgi:hypothetical protein
MSMSRHSYGIWGLVLVLAMASLSWAQSTQPAASDHASLCRQAVALLNQAEEKLKTNDMPEAMSLMKESKSLFSRLEKEQGAVLAERQLTAKEDQQLAINQKLASDLQTQVDRLMESAAAKEKTGRELEAQGQAGPSTASYKKSKEEYLQAQQLSLKAAIYALRNQQIIFGCLAP